MLTKFLKYSNNWTNFDTQFKTYNRSIRMIIFKFDKIDFSTCTCPVIEKKNLCKYVLGMQIKLKLMTLQLR